MLTKKIARIVAVYVVDDVRQTPLKRADKTIVIALVIPAFTPVHVVLPEIHELGILRQMVRKVKDSGGSRQEQKSPAPVLCSCPYSCTLLLNSYGQVDSLKLWMKVVQLKLPLAGWNCVVKTIVQPSTGSTLIVL